MPQLNTISPPDWLGEVVTHSIAQLGDTAPEVAKAAATAIASATDALYVCYGEVEGTARKLAAGTAAKVTAGEKRPPGRMVGGQFVPYHGNEQELAAAASKAFNRAGMVFDKGMASARSAREHLAKRVDAALKQSPAHQSVAAEIRQHVKSLKPAERAPFVFGLVGSGDQTSVGALLGAPPFLSGLDTAQIAQLREAAAAKFAAADNNALKAVDRALATAEAASRSFVERMRPHLSPPVTRRDEAKAALARLATGNAA